MFYCVRDLSTHKVLLISWATKRMFEEVVVHMQSYLKQKCQYKFVNNEHIPYTVFWSNNHRWELFGISLNAEGSLLHREICVAYDLDNSRMCYIAKSNYATMSSILNLELRETIIFNEWNLP